MLERSLQKVTLGTGCLFLISGEAGIGKTGMKKIYLPSPFLLKAGSMFCIL